MQDSRVAPNPIIKRSRISHKNVIKKEKKLFGFRKSKEKLFTKNLSGELKKKRRKKEEGF